LLAKLTERFLPTIEQPPASAEQVKALGEPSGVPGVTATGKAAGNRNEGTLKTARN
jgi:hypothetical protein